MATKLFHIGDILSITTGYLVSPRHMDSVYEILNFMTGDNLFTTQLGRASGECLPHLLKQHPQLTGFDASGVTPENFQERVAGFIEKFGELLPVETIPPSDHSVINPVVELVRDISREERERTEA